MNVFPKRFSPLEPNDSYLECVLLSHMVWQRIISPYHKYNLNMYIESPTSIKLYAWPGDSIYDGKRELHAKVITEFTEDEKKLLDKIVLTIYDAEAKRVLAQQEEKTIQEKITEIRKQMFGV
jgi:hypothetical protein